MLRAIVFDLDGVLIESVDIKTKAFARLFEQEGPEVVRKVVAYHLENGGVSRVEKFRYYYRHVLHRTLLESHLAELCDRFRRLVLDGVINASLVPGALEVLEMCRQGRYLAFVASGTPEDELRVILEQRGMSSYFNGTYGSPALKTEIIQSILSAHRLPPREVLFVGDSITDYEAARQTEVHFVARCTPDSADQWAGLGVKVLRDLRELREYVDGSGQ